MSTLGASTPQPLKTLDMSVPNSRAKWTNGGSISAQTVETTEFIAPSDNVSGILIAWAQIGSDADNSDEMGQLVADDSTPQDTDGNGDLENIIWRVLKIIGSSSTSDAVGSRTNPASIIVPAGLGLYGTKQNTATSSNTFSMTIEIWYRLL